MKRLAIIFPILILFFTAGCAAAPAGCSEPPAFVAPFTGIITLSNQANTLVGDAAYSPESGLCITLTAPASLKGITLCCRSGKGTLSLDERNESPVTDNSPALMLCKAFEQSATVSPYSDKENWVFDTVAGTVTANGEGLPLTFQTKDNTWHGTFTECTLSEYTESSGGTVKG